jgi:hypothetical protein
MFQNMNINVKEYKGGKLGKPPYIFHGWSSHNAGYEDLCLLGYNVI